LFIGMPRRFDVANTGLNVKDYLYECAKTQDSIILPPGAYTVTDKVLLRGQEMQDKTIYAYGAFIELDSEYKKYPDALLEINTTRNVNVFGVTLGYVLPSSGQIRVVDKHLDGDRCLLTVIADAGFMDGFTTTDPSLYHLSWPETFLKGEDGQYRYYCEENSMASHKVTKNCDENGNYDGTMTLELFDRGRNHYVQEKPARDVWDRITLGTVMTCRLSSPNKVSFATISAQNVLFRDCVLYGYSAALSAYAYRHCENVRYVRYHDAARPATLIDKQTYDKYRSYEQKYGVSFELYQDEMGRYRGASARSSSVDAFHISMCRQGVSITSCLLESMVDDGSNQHAVSSRLHDIRDNGDGTTTLIYKPLVSEVCWNSNKNNPDENRLSTLMCMEFQKGHSLYVYNPYGRAIVETEVLDNGVQYGEVEIDLTYNGVHKHITRPLYAIKVRTVDVDLDALIDYRTGKPFDLSDNSYEMTNRITVDNLSFNCTGYTIDNVMVRNGHTRGALIKAANATIKHCTFRNVSYNGIVIRPEFRWGESSVARHTVIDKCLFDHTGFIFQALADKEQACIRIQSTSDTVSEGTLPIDDISITGCRFTNNDQRYAIWVNSAKNVTIKNNVFDPVITDHLPEIPGTAVLLETCMNVEISDNKYNYVQYNGDVRNVIKGENYANIHGTDVTHADGAPIFPDNVK